MPTFTVRNVPEEVHRALKVRAAQHGRSAEAEIRDILETAVKPENRVRMGQLMMQIARDAGITEEEAAIIEQSRDRTPAEPMEFS